MWRQALLLVGAVGIGSCIDTDWCKHVTCYGVTVCDPETAECVCDPDQCPGGYTCDYDETCKTSCVVDSECKDGYVCGSDRTCQLPCDDDDCPDNFACDDYSNECVDRCFVDSDCQDGYECNNYGDCV